MRKTYVALVLVFCVALSVNAQNINNTLGSTGTFTIKDGSTTFFSLTQADGNVSLNNILTLPVTSGSTIGVIYKGSNRFIHDFQASGTDGYNTFVGTNSGNFSMSGSSSEASYNTGAGAYALISNTSGSFNSALGFDALYANTSGNYNSAFGGFALFMNSTGSNNSAFGYYALRQATGDNNAAFGASALSSNTTGSNNSAFGYNSLSSTTSGYDNSAFGHSSLSSNTGNQNSAFGYNSLQSNTAGATNSAFGHSSLYSNTTGNQNSAFGFYSLKSNTTAFYNSAFGFQALYSNTTGNSNSAFGYSALSFNQTGTYNCAVGYASLYNSTGMSNSAIGSFSLSNTTGNRNSALGDSAGRTLTSGSNNTLLGFNAQPSAAAVSDEVVLGDANIQYLRCAQNAISALSDARDKRNIRDLSLGLDFLMTVKPRLYNWDRRDWYEGGKRDGSKMKLQPTAGFIAQELDQAQTEAHAEWLNLVLKSNPERLEATPGNLLPIMVKAIQELKAENDALKKRLSKLEASQTEITALKEETR